MLGSIVASMWLAVSPAAQAQGLVKGVEQGARSGNRAAGTGWRRAGRAKAIGGVTGVIGGVLGGGNNSKRVWTARRAAERSRQGCQDGQGCQRRAGISPPTSRNRSR